MHTPYEAHRRIPPPRKGKPITPKSKLSCLSQTLAKSAPLDIHRLKSQKSAPALGESAPKPPTNK